METHGIYLSVSVPSVFQLAVRIFVTIINWSLLFINGSNKSIAFHHGQK